MNRDIPNKFYIFVTLIILFVSVSFVSAIGNQGNQNDGSASDRDDPPPTTTTTTSPTTTTTDNTIGTTDEGLESNDPSATTGGTTYSKSVIDQLKDAALTGGTFNGVIDQTVTVSINGKDVSFGPGSVSVDNGNFGGDSVTVDGVTYSSSENSHFEPDHDQGVGTPVPPEIIDDSEIFSPAPPDPNDAAAPNVQLPQNATLTIDPDTGDFVIIDHETGETRIFTPPAAQTEPAFTIGETNYTIPADEIRRVYDQLDISDLDGSNNPALPVFDMTYSTAAGYTITNTQSTSTISASNINAQNIKDITLVTDSSGAVVAVSLTSTADNNTITIGTMEFLLNTDDTLDLYIDSDGKVFAQVEGNNAIINDYDLSAGCVTLSPGSKYKYLADNARSAGNASLRISNTTLPVSLPNFDPFALYNPGAISGNNESFFLCIRSLPNQNFDYSCAQCGTIDAIDKDGYLRGAYEYEKLLSSSINVFADVISSEQVNTNLAFDPLLATLAVVHGHKKADFADFSSGPFLARFEGGIYRFRFSDLSRPYSLIQVFPLINIYDQTMHAHAKENNVYYYEKGK